MAWRVANSLNTLLNQINTRFPHRSKISDGSIGDAAHSSRTSYHNPDRDGVVRARDFTHDPHNGLDIDRFTDELAAQRDPRLLEMIANGLYWHHSNPRWVTYHGSNPHTRHVHISVKAPPLGDQAHPWHVPMLGAAPQQPAPPPPAQEDDDMKPDERAALFLLVNEFLGPRGKNGQIAGWGTTNGPRTVVAMLVDLVNAAYQPIPSAVSGSKVKLAPRQALANADAYGWSNAQRLAGLLAAFDELADAYASERGTDAETIKQAVRDALATSTVDVDVTVSGTVTDSNVGAERRTMGDTSDA